MTTVTLTKDLYNKNDLFSVMTVEHKTDSLPHRHEFFELAYINSGSAEHCINGQVSTITKGDYFILEPSNVHYFKKTGNENLIVTNVMFLPELIDYSLKDTTRLGPIFKHYLIEGKSKHKTISIDCYPTLFKDNNDVICNIIKNLEKEFNQKNFAYQEIARTLVVQILIYSIRTASKQTNLECTTFSKMLIEEIEKNPGSNRILQRFSKKVNYSESYISKKFKEETGSTFVSYLQNYRIELCCRLLANSDLSVSEIAEKIGYSDWSFFHKLFKNKKNCTPNEYRKKYSPIP